MFLIKLQKAKSIIKKNGLKNGLEIVGGYLGTYLKSFFVGSGDILFITGGVGDKAHFRAFGVAEELSHHGFKTATAMADNFWLLSLVGKFEIFVLHKITVTEKIEKFIEAAKKQKKEIIFDTDDLDYDPQYLKYMDYYSKISEVEKKEYEKGIGAEIVNDPYVKVATTTVNYLADKLREKGKEVFVLKNKISDHELEIIEKLYNEEKFPSSVSTSTSSHLLPPASLKLQRGERTGEGEVVIGYFSGTPSHDKDFMTVAPVLKEILEKYKKVKLILAGPLDVGNILNKFSDQLEILPRVPRDDFHANVKKCDINIVPLEIDNPFCEAKSEIKFMEAGALGIPTVAAKNRTYSETIEDGIDGFLAATPEEWQEKLERLIRDNNLRLTMGEKARRKVFRDYTNKNSHSEEYYAYLHSILEG